MAQKIKMTTQAGVRDLEADEAVLQRQHSGDADEPRLGYNIRFGRSPILASTYALFEGDSITWADGRPILKIEAQGIVEVCNNRGENFPITCEEIINGRLTASLKIHE
jgi:hypothetical protein